MITTSNSRRLIPFAPIALIGELRHLRWAVRRISAPFGLILCLGVLPPLVSAAVVIVDTTADVVDFGGAQQVADLPGSDGLITFREAVLAVNNTPGPDAVAFNIPLDDPGFFNGQYFVIEVSSDIVVGVSLTDDETTIDGFTQTLFTGDTNPDGPEIFWQGYILSSSSNGMTVQSDDNVIQGIGGFRYFRYGVQFLGNGNIVRGCILDPNSAGVEIRGANNVVGGLNPEDRNTVRSSGVGVWMRLLSSGNLIQGNLITQNRSGGVVLEDAGPGNVIGGPEPGARNVINQNGHFSGEFHPVGSQVDVTSSGNIVQGNFLGVDETGTSDVSGAAAYGVFIRGSDNLVLDNVISGHGPNTRGHRAGVLVVGGGNNVLKGNKIGTDVGGTVSIPNEVGVNVDIFLFNDVPHDVTIGGTGDGEGNVIAFNVNDGVLVQGISNSYPMGIAISGNSIFSNGDLGIDLVGEGVTPNDPGDADEGPNNLLNFPVLNTASDDGLATTVSGSVDVPNPETVVLEFFANSLADPSGFGEGETLVGVATPNPDGTFLAMFDPGLAGQHVSATTQDLIGNTSEFSATIQVDASTSTVGDVAGPGTLRLSQNSPNPVSGSALVWFDLPWESAVYLDVIDVAGRRVTRIADEVLAGGRHVREIDTSGLSPGIYYYRLAAGTESRVRKMTVIR